MGGSISGSSPSSISSSGPVISARISYNSVGSESLPSKSSSPTSINFFPNEHSRESPFFLMFGRDPLLPLTKLLRPKL